MLEQQNFRSAFNGFNREDVVHYLEYINTKHTNQVNALTTEVEELRARLAQQSDDGQLQAQCADLIRQLAEAEE